MANRPRLPGRCARSGGKRRSDEAPRRQSAALRRIRSGPALGRWAGKLVGRGWHERDPRVVHGPARGGAGHASVVVLKDEAAASTTAVVVSSPQGEGPVHPRAGPGGKHRAGQRPRRDRGLLLCGRAPLSLGSRRRSSLALWMWRSDRCLSGVVAGSDSTFRRRSGPGGFLATRDRAIPRGPKVLVCSDDGVVLTGGVLKEVVLVRVSDRPRNGCSGGCPGRRNETERDDDDQRKATYRERIFICSAPECDFLPSCSGRVTGRTHAASSSRLRRSP
jgi:hypothetical protein